MFYFSKECCAMPEYPFKPGEFFRYTSFFGNRKAGETGRYSGSEHNLFFGVCKTQKKGKKELRKSAKSKTCSKKV